MPRPIFIGMRVFNFLPLILAITATALAQPSSPDHAATLEEEIQLTRVAIESITAERYRKIRELEAANATNEAIRLEFRAREKEMADLREKIELQARIADPRIPQAEKALAELRKKAADLKATLPDAGMKADQPASRDGSVTTADPLQQLEREEHQARQNLKQLLEAAIQKDQRLAGLSDQLEKAGESADALYKQLNEKVARDPALIELDRKRLELNQKLNQLLEQDRAASSHSTAPVH